MLPAFLPHPSETPPLRWDADGAVRISGSRVTLDLLVEQYDNGMTPEEFVRAYDSVSLPDVHGAIAYLLRHRVEVQAYLDQRRSQAHEQRRRIETATTPVTRMELLSRRVEAEPQHAATGG